MPSDAWIAAAKRADRQQVLLMVVESVDAIQTMVTTAADWAASKAINCNVVDDAGSAYCNTDGPEKYSGTFSPVSSQSIQSPFNYQLGAVNPDGSPGPVAVDQDAVITLASPYANVTGISVAFIVHLTEPEPSTVTVKLEASRNGAPYQLVRTIAASAQVNGAYTLTTDEIPKGPYTLRLTLDASTASYPGGGLTGTMTLTSVTWTHLVTYLPGSIQTKSLDLGLVPTIASTLSVDARIPAGASLPMTARGSNDNAAWTPLGTVADGSSLPPYRYYDVSATLTPSADGLNTPEIYEVRITGGDAQYRYFGTHEDTPFQGVRPLLLPTLGSASAKLELMKLGSTGEVTPQMYYCKESFELLRDGYLRDKAVTIKLGFKGLSEADYEPIFSGLWYDGAIDLKAGTVDIKTRTVFSRFSKVQIPAENSGQRSNQTVRPKIFTNVNVIAAMLDLINYLGMPGRWVDQASANAIMTGPRAGDDWLISRALTKDNKEDALKLLEELVVISGVDILQQPDGKLVFHLYDPAEADSAEISADIATFGNVELGQAELYTRQQIYYEPRHEGDLETGSVFGGWIMTKAYAIGDSLPTATDLTWHALASHTSDSTNEPEVGTNWRSIWAPSWQSGVQYYIGNKVWQGGSVYTALADNVSTATNAPGTAGTAWNAGSALAAGATYGDWVAGYAMARNMSVRRGSRIWFCINDHNSDVNSCPGEGALYRAYWTTLWESGIGYVVGDVRIGRGPLYTCKVAHTSAADNEPGHSLNWRNFWTCQPAKSGSSAEDFYNVYVRINEAAEIAWGLNKDVSPSDSNYLTNPGYSKMWYEKWAASQNALTALADRMDRWFATPRMKTRASELPPQFWGVPLGAMVGVTGLILPSAGATWGAPCSKKKFRVLSKSLDPQKCTVNIDLREE
jgi:hypothetical protein